MTPIMQESLSRIAQVFRIRIEDLNLAMRFGTDLKASFVSDFFENELDQLLYDIQEMQAAVRHSNLNADQVCTVGDFCLLVEQYQVVDPEGYRRLVASWEKEATICQKSRGRRVLFKLFGV